MMCLMALSLAKIVFLLCWELQETAAYLPLKDFLSRPSLPWRKLKPQTLRSPTLAPADLRSSSCLFNDAVEGDGNESAFDVDSARKQLQSLFGDDAKDAAFDLQAFLKEEQSSSSFANRKEPSKTPDLDKTKLPPLPPLSTIERDVRVAEIQLLKNLKEDDSPVPQLWDLWYSQRGGEALGRLRQADQLMADPTSWRDCEDSLNLLVEEYSIYFVEPLNRLATLYYLQGRMEASYHLCRLILLYLKPWHLGALAGMVQVCLALGNRDEARFWATKRLPTVAANTGTPPFDGGPTNPRRFAWVDEMVDAAENIMKQAEKSTKKQLGKREEYYDQEEKEGDSGIGDNNADDSAEDAWQ